MSADQPSYNDKLNFFFRSPRDAPQSGQSFSQLYLLRRDIDTCFGIDPNTGNHTPHCSAIWPGVMTVLTGVDLLGQFMVGTDKGEVGVRFQSFLQKYMLISESESVIIYQLRNALLHTFGLYAEKTNRDGKVTATYRFTLGGNVPKLLTVISPDHYQVDVQRLRERFETSVGKYAQELRDQITTNPSVPKDNFQEMFDKYKRAVSVSPN
ncbi:MAG: hypothetical protein M0Z50_09785 [Planctomycetia bacterium]|nr:hypothetical protein [Planctomycetia bacterium]